MKYCTIKGQKEDKNTYNKPIKRMTFIDYQTFDGFCFVRLIGLEPTQLALLDPKSSASTNFATGAVVVERVCGSCCGFLRVQR